MLTLTNGPAACVIYPDLGGSIGGWTIGTQAMLRSASPAGIAVHDPLTMASFPLVPFSNRIGRGHFFWDGQGIAITPNFAPEPHAVHGLGWTSAWTVAAQSERDVTLTLDHRADARWPWDFSARQQIALTADRLILTLSARNDADHAAPLAFGHHPYFDAAGATLQFSAESMWLAGDNALPTKPVAIAGEFDFSVESPIAGRGIDNCYAGVAGPVHVRWAGRTHALIITPSPELAAAVVYVPKGGDSFCFEPVAHINNALNLPGHQPAMPIIAPEESFTATIDFQAVAA